MNVRGLRVASLGERMADDLRERLIRGEFAEGDRLVEDALAREYDVSRGPVRDALKQMAGEQLVDVGRGGATVRAVDGTWVDEIYAVRTALEPLALRLAAERGDDENWQQAEALVQEMERCADRGEGRAFAEADLSFHDAFYEVAGNRRLLAVWRQHQPTFRAMIRIATAQDQDLHPSAADHRTLLRYVRAGAVEEAERALVPHLEGSRLRMRSALRPR